MTGFRSGRCHTAVNTALNHEVTVLAWTHRPADDHTGIQIQHDAEIQPMLGRANVGDVGDPFGAESGSREVALQMVLRPGRRETRGLPPPGSARTFDDMMQRYLVERSPLKARPRAGFGTNQPSSISCRCLARECLAT